MTLIQDEELRKILIDATPSDLGTLIDIITDRGNGRISLSSNICKDLLESKQLARTDDVTKAHIANEIQMFAGNTLMNLFRGGKGVPYKELLTDVAEHLKCKPSGDDSCIAIELAIISKLLSQAIENMSEQEVSELMKSVYPQGFRGTGGVSFSAIMATVQLSSLSAFNATALVASASSNLILGKTLALGVSGGAGRGIGAFLGPIGWSIATIWTVYDLAAPAYRVTVPCVIHLAYMRQRKLTQICPSCGFLTLKSEQQCTNCKNDLSIFNLRLPSSATGGN